jgi:(1->4)-alpha-D-glucan 1-alpha-D-glucosylmutase
LKIASPGVPDFYQGNELWSFHLVDPDNRSPVDYESRRRLLSKLRPKSESDAAALLDRLVERPCDGAIKLYVTSRALTFRKAHRHLFAQGSYIPMQLDGSRGRHAVAFARASEDEVLLALTGRFFLKLRNSSGNPVGESVWNDTRAVLPKRFAQRRFEDVLSGQIIEAQQHNGNAVIPLARAFEHCPAALLFARSSD